MSTISLLYISVAISLKNICCKILFTRRVDIEDEIFISTLIFPKLFEILLLIFVIVTRGMCSLYESFSKVRLESRRKKIVNLRSD